MQNFSLIKPNWDELFYSCVSQSQERVRIACPFIKQKPVEILLQHLPSSASINCLNSFKLAYFHQQVSDLGALSAIIKRQGTIKSLKYLHAKIYIFDDKKAIITSANLTEQALKRNYEYGVLIEEKSVVADIISDFDTLFASEEVSPVTPNLISDAEKILAGVPKLPTIKFPKLNIEEPTTDDFSGGVEIIVNTLTGWKKAVFLCLNKIESKVFTADAVYAFENELRQEFPENNNIKDKIRQQLQYLRDLGLVEFLDNKGNYKKLWS
jgi:predicted Rdx family selenoprotein